MKNRRKHQKPPYKPIEKYIKKHINQYKQHISKPKEKQMFSSSPGLHFEQGLEPGEESLRAQLVRKMEKAFGVKASAVRLNIYRSNKAGGLVE